jgi:P27 family predicted phage terminase small subunit
MAGKKGRSGRRRIPSAVKKARGTYRPSRAAKNEVQVELGTPDMPDWIARDPEARAEWEHIAPILEKARVLSDPDKAMLADYCAAHSLAVNATKRYMAEGIIPRAKRGAKMMHVHPMIKVAQEARNQAARLGAEFGLSPASRSRVSAVPRKGGDADEGDEQKKGEAKDETPLFGPPRLVVGG